MKEQTKVSTGSKVINKLLKGGIERGVLTTIYGPAGSGKTNICIMAAIETAKNKNKVIYIDTEGGFSAERFKQLSANKDYLFENVFFLTPFNFKEQKKAFEKLKDLMKGKNKVDLVIVDTIAMLYRLEIGKTKDIYETNKELGEQLSYLSELARKKNIPILITNQVYADFENKGQVKMVGGDILKYSSKCLIELKNLASKKAAVIRKHRSLPEDKKVFFKIMENGFEEV